MTRFYLPFISRSIRPCGRGERLVNGHFAVVGMDFSGLPCGRPGFFADQAISLIHPTFRVALPYFPLDVSHASNIF